MNGDGGEREEGPVSQAMSFAAAGCCGLEGIVRKIPPKETVYISRDMRIKVYHCRRHPSISR
jgi:hypothetical protein